MYAYCGNNSVVRIDSAGTSFRQAFSVSCYEYGGSLCDYVIYYYHPESSENLDGPAIHNHKAANNILVPAKSFEELITAMNNVPSGIDDIYIYMHSTDEHFSFYHGNYHYAKDIAVNIRETFISGEIYLFSCKGGRGELASAMSTKTNRTVIASVYKVSFGDCFARCSWKDFYWYSRGYDEYSWHSYYPDGSTKPTSEHYIFVG